MAGLLRIQFPWGVRPRGLVRCGTAWLWIWRHYDLSRRPQLPVDTVYHPRSCGCSKLFFFKRSDSSSKCTSDTKHIGCSTSFVVALPGGPVQVTAD